MSAMIDVTCPHCSRRHGWCGTMANRPACPACGYRPAQADLDAVDAKMEAARALMAAQPRGMHREQRLDAGLTLRRAAQLLECGAAYLSDIEAGRTQPSPEMAADMARVYAIEDANECLHPMGDC